MSRKPWKPVDEQIEDAFHACADRLVSMGLRRHKVEKILAAPILDAKNEAVLVRQEFMRELRYLGAARMASKLGITRDAVYKKRSAYLKLYS